MPERKISVSERQYHIQESEEAVSHLLYTVLDIKLHVKLAVVEVIISYKFFWMMNMERTHYAEYDSLVVSNLILPTTVNVVKHGNN